MKNICVGHETTKSGIESMTLHLITLFMGNTHFVWYALLKIFWSKVILCTAWMENNRLHLLFINPSFGYSRKRFMVKD